MKETMHSLVKLFNDNKLTISLAESVTCGLASHQLNTVKGTSQVLMGSVVCYNENTKKSLFKVPASMLKKHTAESQQVTDELAKKLNRFFKTDVFAAVTGLAASGGSETKAKPVGTIYFSFIYRGKLFRKRENFIGTPLQIKRKACESLFKFISVEIKKQFQKKEINSFLILQNNTCLA